LRYSLLLRISLTRLDFHPAIKLFPAKAVIRLRITIGLGVIGALNNALCPPGGDHRVCDRVLSNPLAVLKESPVGEHHRGRTVIFADATTPEPPRRETM
jgi:hypothetical protein